MKEDVVVYTTINWDLQKEAEFVIKEAVPTEAPKGFSQGALVSMDVDGTVRAWSAASTTSKSQFNRAVTGGRQPGSAFKPFVYLAAMEKGYTPDTVAEDAPIDINGWAPKNADGKYGGEMTLRQASPIRATPSRPCSPSMSAPTRWSRRRCAWAFPRR
jgi:penicillin-binding protein 1A